MPDFSFDTGFGDVDPYSTFGAGGYANVSTDVSMGAPDEQPYTPTGNGTGVFLDSGTQNGIFTTLDKVLNYALYRDQQKMTAVQFPAQQQQTQMAAARANDSRLLTFAMIGAGIYLLVSMGKG